MELAAANRAYDRVHEKAVFHDGTFTSWREKASKSHPYHYRDGITLSVGREDEHPDDDFTTNVNAKPGGVVDGDPPGEGDPQPPG